MKNLWIILVVAFSAYSADTTGTWNGGSSDMNATANYNWSPATPGAITGDCPLIFDAGSTGATATGNITAKSLVSTSGYSGAISWSTRTMTLQRMVCDHTSTMNIGTAINISGDSLHIGSGVGTVTGSSCTVTQNGTTAIDVDRLVTFKSLVVNGTTSVVGGSNLTLSTAGSAVPLVIGNGSTLTANGGLILTLSTSGRLITTPASYTLNGTTTSFTLSCADGTLDTLPKLVMGGSLFLNMACPSSASKPTYILSDTLINSNTIYIKNVATAGSKVVVDFNGKYVQVPILRIGSLNSTGYTKLFFRNSITSIGQFKANMDTAATISDSILLGSSIDTVKYIGLHSTTYWQRDTSEIVTGDSAVNLDMKKNHFWKLTFNSAGKRSSSPDTIFVDNYLKINAGRAVVGSGWVIGDSLLFAGSDSIVGKTARAEIRLKNNNSVLRSTNTGALRYLDSTDIRFDSSSYWYHDSAATVRSIKFPIAGRLHRLQSGKKITALKYDAGDWDGSAGNLDSIVSTSAGNSDTIKAPANIVVQYAHFKDQSFDSAVICTTGCYNGGNNYNVVYDYPEIGTLSSNTALANCEVTDTMVGLRFRTSGGALTVGASSATITKQVADTVIFTFTTPAIAGTYNLIYDNGGNLKDTAEFFVTTPCTGPAITAHPAAITVTEPTTAMFAVIATGDPVLSYQWQKNSSNIAGATASSYTTPATSYSDNATTFRCIVTNTCGTATSNEAILTVATIPVITSIAPVWQKRGLTFKLRGTGFRTPQGDGTLYLGTSDLLEAKVWSDTLIEDTIPASWSPRGTYNVIIKNSTLYRDTTQIRVLIPTITGTN